MQLISLQDNKNISCPRKTVRFDFDYRLTVDFGNLHNYYYRTWNELPGVFPDQYDF